MTAGALNLALTLRASARRPGWLRRLWARLVRHV